MCRIEKMEPAATDPSRATPHSRKRPTDETMAVTDNRKFTGIKRPKRGRGAAIDPRQQRDIWHIQMESTSPTKNLDGRSHLRDGLSVFAPLLSPLPAFDTIPPTAPTPKMRLTRTIVRLHLFIVAASLSGGIQRDLKAAEAPRTEMAPFKVEAEFGVDGLRIQNSNSVLNQYLLEQHGVAQMQDVAGIAPNLGTSNSDTRGFGDVMSLRGVSNSIFFSSPAVALTIDDVPSGSVSSYPSTLLNIESFVVKAGPQGTDYGRHAPGGVIDIKTRVPGATHQGKVLVDYGSFNTGVVQAAFDGPLNDKVGYSVSVGLTDHDGYIENTFRKRTEDDRRSVAGRGALFWKAADDLQVRFGLAMEKINDNATRLSSLFSPNPFVVTSDLNGETKINRFQLSLQAKKTFVWGSVTSTTSRQKWDLDPSSTDLDLSQLPLAFSRVAQNEEVWTQEIRLESKPAANRSQWRAGLFYLDSTVKGNALREFMVTPSAFVPPGFVQTERTIFEIEQTNLAAYANVDFPLAEKTMLKAGVRVERAGSELDRTKDSSNNFRFPSPQDPRLERSQDHNYLSATAGMVHSLSSSLSLQAKTSVAQKPEGYSGFTGIPALARFNNERQWSTEAGVTFGPPKGRFGGSVLGFYSVIDRYQLERTVPNSTDFVVVNAAAVIARGFEAKFMWSPVANVWWDFQAGYTDATFDDHRDASGTRVDGKRVPFIPTYTLRTGVTVDLGRGLSANASYASVGRTFYDERNTAMFAQKTYGIVNAQLRYRFDRYTVTVYAQNLFQKNYYQFINPEIFAGSPSAPRRIGIQLSFVY
ncbi:MAG: TonB-dependent receptor [Opitutus sp.]|nr:TonB-dependent receptor [Opitutus sp.]